KLTYNKKADNYDQTLDGIFTRKFKLQLVDYIELDDGQNVLDVACGNGTLLSMLKGKKPVNGYGVDIAERMILNAVKDHPDIEFHVSGCESMPFQNESMDIITVCAAYHHFPDVAAFAGEVWRLLKPRGKIYIADVYLPTILRLIINPFVPFSRSGDVKFYSPKEIVGNFEQFGFRKVGTRISGTIMIVSMEKRSLM
ncbi:MAG: class I SAM-dependent methyltransferase, partial [Peptococcaceae bacterium]|nr:class I SAM-dependent methyltransferase [Peptococcaceae bacterium]